MSEEWEGDRCVLRVAGELDLLTAPELSVRLNEVVRRPQGDVVLDLTKLEFIDSVGLHTLLNAKRRLTRQARALTVISPDGPVRHVIDLSRLTETLGVVSSWDELPELPDPA
jgi:anti-sigma B factor antagonist